MFELDANFAMERREVALPPMAFEKAGPAQIRSVQLSDSGHSMA